MIFFDPYIFEDIVTAIVWGVVAGIFVSPFLAFLRRKRRGKTKVEIET